MGEVHGREGETDTERMSEKVPKRIVDYVLENGFHYVSTVCPDDVKRGPIGTCFDTAMVNALGGKYRYVEGLAKNKKTGEWMLHGWIAGGQMMHEAYDPTWKCVVQMKDGSEILVAVPTEYVGIEMDTMLMVKFMMKTKYCSVLANGWRAPKEAAAVLGGEENYKKLFGSRV